MNRREHYQPRRWWFLLKMPGLHVVHRKAVLHLRQTTRMRHTATDVRDLSRRRKRKLEVVLLFYAWGLLLGGSNFAGWVLWPSIGFVFVIVRMWVKRNFFEGRRSVRLRHHSARWN